MTTEEKAKAYDEAIKKAKEIKEKIVYSHLSTESCKAVSEYIDTIIPELRESEDERIRKEIIDFLETIPISELKRVPRPICKWFFWLEKQKEHHIPWYDYQKSKEAGYTIVPNEEYEQLIKQKEQKPAEWSEEDELCFDSFFALMNLLDDDIPEKKPVIKWVKQLKSRFSNSDPRSVGLHYILKSQPHWKPSEEQMDALKELIDDANKAGWVTPGATELYEQLKKLM